jgi:hypothetical protein
LCNKHETAEKKQRHKGTYSAHRWLAFPVGHKRVGITVEGMPNEIFTSLHASILQRLSSWLAKTGHFTQNPPSTEHLACLAVFYHGQPFLRPPTSLFESLQKDSGGHFEGLSNSHNIFQTNVSFSTFDTAHIGPVDTRFISQRLLRDPLV